MNAMQDALMNFYNYVNDFFNSSIPTQFLGRVALITGVFSAIIFSIFFFYGRYRKNPKNRDPFNIWLWHRGGIIILIGGIVCYQLGFSLEIAILENISIEIMGVGLLGLVLVLIDRGASLYFTELEKKDDRKRGLYRKRRPSIKRNLNRNRKLKAKRKTS